HRDLKPANIKVTPDGILKVLDFGLAKAGEEGPGSGAGSPTMSPTISLEMTHAGMILGTAAYMSPEQARGKVVDKRADIWTFGVVFFEMLTGTMLFGGGETVSDSMVSVITKEPDWSALPKETPAHVVRLLKRCLRKDPRMRLRDIGDARIALEEPEAKGDIEAARKPGGLPHWAAIGALAILLAGLAFVHFRETQTEALAPPTGRFPLPLPEGASLSRSPAAPQVVPSPDGRFLAEAALLSNKSTGMWVRPLGSTAPRLLEGTEDANFPFWSPDGQYIGYFTTDQVKRIAVAGGAPQTICGLAAPATGDLGFSASRGTVSDGDGATWSREGVIVFANRAGGPLMRVPAAGGNPSPAFPGKPPEGTYYAWPEFLPDGRHILYLERHRDTSQNAIYVQEVGSVQRVQVMKNLTRAVWAPPGYLLFARETTLFAQHMDPKTFRLSGEPLTVAEDLTVNPINGRSAFAVSNNGVLAFRRGGNSRQFHLWWYDRDGKQIAAAATDHYYGATRISPDGRKAALWLGPAPADIWVLDFASGIVSRMTNGANAGTAIGPWSPDSQHLIVNRADDSTILDVTIAAATARPMGIDKLTAEDISPDGRTLLGVDENSHRLIVVPLGDPKPQTIRSTPWRENRHRFSPDGKYVAYVSDESGTPEIMVASFPSFAEKRRISAAGAFAPAWRRDGRELFFMSLDQKAMSAEVSTAGKLDAMVPKPLFRLPRTSFAPSPDGQRFLVGEPIIPNQEGDLLVLNWAADLKQGKEQ
ncbi:MAG TPA: protein kinase, partial [bacterium]|nr:protein kinase [bacterium]